MFIIFLICTKTSFFPYFYKLYSSLLILHILATYAYLTYLYISPLTRSGKYP